MRYKADTVFILIEAHTLIEVQGHFQSDLPLIVTKIYVKDVFNGRCLGSKWKLPLAQLAQGTTIRMNMAIAQKHLPILAEMPTYHNAK